MFTCPVCFYDQLEEPASDYNICDCCGTEFGNDDSGRSSDELRAAWLGKGAPWFFREPPASWNPYVQLHRANALAPGVISFSPAGSRRSDSVHLQKSRHPVEAA